MAVLHKVMESRELSGHLGHHLDDEVPSLPVIDSGTSFNPTAALPRLSTFNVDSPRLHEMADDILDLKDSPRIGVTSNDSSISQDSNKENNPNLESHMASNDEFESDDIAPDERPLLMNLKSSETFVSRLDDKEKLRMDATRIQRANPFTKLKREKTKKMLKEMHDIANAKEDLPKLAGWLEKRQPHLPYSWQKRWVVVKGEHFLWSDKMKTIQNPKDRKQRKAFGNSISLMLITEIAAVDTKQKNARKFVLKLREGAAKRTEYIWKCTSEEDAMFWRKGIRKHQKHLQSLCNYLGTKKSTEQ